MEKDSQDRVFSPRISQADFNWDEWSGLPYAYWGKYGCWGLVRAVILNGIGTELPSFEEYDMESEKGAKTILTMEAQARLTHWKEVACEEAQMFDVLIFRGTPNHVGVVCRQELFLHVQRNDHSRIERYRSRQWINRIEGVYRYIDVHSH